MNILKAIAERAGKTFLQVYFAQYLVGDAVLNAFEMDWLGPNLGVALGATALSLVTSALSLKLGDGEGPSLTNEVVVPDNRPPHVG